MSVNEAVARGLSLCPDLGLQGLPDLCQGGDTISLLRLFHYFPYGNDDDDDDDGGGGGGGGSGGGTGGNGKTRSDGDGESNRPESGPGKTGSSPHTDW